MLKIKDNVDFESLKSKYHIERTTCDLHERIERIQIGKGYNSFYINPKTRIIYYKVTDSCVTGKFDLIYDMIQDGIVEKVEK